VDEAEAIGEQLISAGFKQRKDEDSESFYNRLNIIGQDFYSGKTIDLSGLTREEVN